MSRPRNHSLTYREKNCRRGHLRPRQDNLELKDSAATFFVQLKIRNYYKKRPRNGSRGLFWEREVLVSRTLNEKYILVKLHVVLAELLKSGFFISEPTFKI
jgi:hypothetical protein